MTHIMQLVLANVKSCKVYFFQVLAGHVLDPADGGHVDLFLPLAKFLNNKVSQGSVATRLRRGGIFNDQFLTRSLLSPVVEEF